MLDKSKIKTVLLLGGEIPINESLTIIQPNISDIVEIGYYEFITGAYFFYNPKDVCIENKGLYDFFEKNELDDYGVMSYILDNDDEAVSIIKKFLKMHVKGDFDIRDGKIYIDGDTVMCRDTYNEVSYILKTCYDFEERLDDQGYDEVAKIFKIRNIRNKRRARRKFEKNKDNKDLLFNILSIVLTRKEKDSIYKMTMYQLLNYFKTINREKSYEAILAGVYSGTVDKKHGKNIWVYPE